MAVSSYRSVLVPSGVFFYAVSRPRQTGSGFPGRVFVGFLLPRVRAATRGSHAPAAGGRASTRQMTRCGRSKEEQVLYFIQSRDEPEAALLL